MHMYTNIKNIQYTQLHIHIHYHHRPRLWAETNRATLRPERVLLVCPRW